MRYSTSSALVLATAVSQAVAGPHRVHRHQHDKKEAKPDVDWSALDWNNMGIDWTSAYNAGLKTKTSSSSSASATPTAASTTPAADALAETTPSVTTSSTGTSSAASTSSTNESLLDSIEGDLAAIEDEISLLWNGLTGASNTRTAFGAVVVATGSGDEAYMNYGNPYGSNVYKVDSHASESYTIEFVNTQSKTITINIWNKNGPDGQPLSGSAYAPKNTTLTMALPAGKSQIVAFDEDSGVAWAEACDSTTSSGAYDTTWGEGTFHSTGSGYDMSAIMNSAGNTYNMTITSVEAPACTSDPTQNYWLTATEPIGNSDGSCYIAQSTASLTVLMAGAI